MKSCREEYRDCAPQEIAEQYIEGTPQVGEEPVYPDEAPRIHGMSNEDSSMHEGTVVYDVRFTALAPSTGEPIRLIINLEAQNSYYPGYPIVTRALYNCNRLISSQYEGCYRPGISAKRRITLQAASIGQRIHYHNHRRQIYLEKG